MNKNTVQKLLKIDIGLIIIGLINWIRIIYPKYNGNFDLANNILVYGITICSMLAIFYILFGFDKEYGSKVFKIFMNVFAVIELSTLINHADQTAFEVITTALRFATLVLLSEAKDLGEKKAKLIALIPIATSIADLIELACLGYIAYAWQGIAIEIVLQISVLLFITAKYIDKKERGAKI